MANTVESLAKQLVFNYEKKKGRTPIDKSGKGYDIISSGRLIEIKSRSIDYPKSCSFFISRAQYEMLRRKNNYYIYVVYNLEKSKEHKLRIISKANSPRIKEEKHYRVTFRKNDWSKLKIINL